MTANDQIAGYMYGIDSAPAGADRTDVFETALSDPYGADEADAAACSAMAAALRLGGDHAPTPEDYTAGLARMRERLAATR